MDRITGAKGVPTEERPGEREDLAIDTHQDECAEIFREFGKGAITVVCGEPALACLAVDRGCDFDLGEAAGETDIFEQ